MLAILMATAGYIQSDVWHDDPINRVYYYPKYRLDKPEVIVLNSAKEIVKVLELHKYRKTYIVNYISLSDFKRIYRPLPVRLKETVLSEVNSCIRSRNDIPYKAIQNERRNINETFPNDSYHNEEMKEC